MSESNSETTDIVPVDIIEQTYAAMVNRTAVCEGYTSLAYRLLKESDINTRIISGTSSGEKHAWIITEIDGLYYNLDSTWDEGKSWMAL